MDDLLVIILTLIIAVVGALNQVRKKKAQPVEEQPESESSTSDFWEFLDDDEETVVPIREKEVKAKTVEEPIPEPIQINLKPRYQFSAQNEGKSVSMERMKPELKKAVKGSNIKDEFSLRKAVIYSEILNRKYT